MLRGYTMETIAPAKQREEHENKVDGETLNDFIPRYHVVLRYSVVARYKWFVFAIAWFYNVGLQHTWFHVITWFDVIT